MYMHSPKVVGPNNDKVKGYTSQNESGFRKLRLYDTDSTPSWKRFGDGTAEANFHYCPVDPAKPASGWLEIGVAETPEGGKGAKRAYITIPEWAVEELRKLLAVKP